MTARRLATMGAVLLLARAAAGGDTGSIKGTVSGPDGPVADAVVTVDAPAPAAPAPAHHAVVEQRNQMFVPRVVGVPVGTTVDFPNHDPMLHNLYSASPAKKFDLGMYGEGETKSVTFDTPGVVRLLCNAHPKMQAFVVVSPNPWIAVTDAHGGYTITGVPAGSRTVHVWHERLAETTLPVVVSADQVQPLDVRLTVKR
jgi:plastocyanin